MYPRISHFKTTDAFRARLAELELDLPVDDRILTAAEHSPLAEPIRLFGRRVGNRWCVQPMEGWDGTPEGMPSEHTFRRWRRFGESGAKLIFGGEATAVRHDGRSNPHQLLLNERNKSGFARLLETLKDAHRQKYGETDDLLVGLQLTHSGRFSKPNRDDQPEPKILYHHPILDRRMGIDPHDHSMILTDAEIDALIDCYVAAARMAAETGFDFVDLKHCHGYLGHEFLSAYTREGRYGGSFENRTRFLRTLVERIRMEVPDLAPASRISAFDWIPFCDDESTRKDNKKGVGVPEPFEALLPYRYGFGVDPDDPTRLDLTETFQLIALLESLNLSLVNVTCGSPYYNPHIQRPAYFPPSDGYRPPEDPLVGVVRLIQTTKEIKRKFPNLIFIGSGYTYLQEFLPQTAQAVVRDEWTDFVGIGRMILVYPTLPSDSLTLGKLDSKRICRTFSDCTTAPRHGLISGCYPLDEYYKSRLEAEQLKEIKRGI